MSWLTNLRNSVISAIEGKGSTPIIDTPTTPVQEAVNTLGTSVSTATAAATTVVGTAAAAAVNGYLDTTIGPVPTEIADASLEALAATAISKMSSSQNKTEAEIGEALGSFLSSFTAPAAAA